MRVHSEGKIKELKKFRRKGYSINELVRELSVPKTTVWHHVHNIQVLPKYVSVLRSKRGGSKQRSQKNWAEAEKQAHQLLMGANRDLAIAITMLYWAEGSKRGCNFINSDGKMIELYLNLLRKVLKVPREAISITIRIFTGMDRAECLRYWSRITNINQSKYHVRFNDGTTRCRTQYGMCRITVLKGDRISKIINSLIDQFVKEVIVNN